MQFKLAYQDVKRITTGLAPIADKSRPPLQKLQFDLDAGVDGRVLVTVSAIDGFVAAATSVHGWGYSEDERYMFSVPTFKVPAGTARSCKDKDIVFTVLEEQKTLTVDFDVTQIVLPVYADPLPLKWDRILKKDEPTLSIWFNREVLERALKAFDKGIHPPVRLDFYDHLSQVVMIQPGTEGDTLALALPVKFQEGDAKAQPIKDYISSL